MMDTIGFLGCGNMGGAIARAVCKAVDPKKVFLANRTAAKAQALAKELGCKTATNAEVAGDCDLIFLAVKPQMMEQMLSGLVPILKARKDRFVLASMAAGLDARRIQEMAGGAYPVICLMPNTPVAVGAGVVQYYGVDATEEELSDFQNLLSAAGMIDRVDPERLNAASAVSGCGPAFCAMFIEALADGGVACGLPRDKALAYAAKMAEGTARLMLENHAHPGQLKDGVCSPGGTTIQGVRTLEDRGFRSAVMEAVIAAYEKTIALGK
jgi:pyrroline-5-carboxylate reductase